MKPKALGAVVMVALAWVLWEKVLNNDREVWEPLSGFSSKELCTKSAQDYFLNMKLSNPGNSALGSKDGLMVYETYNKEKLRATYYFRCFPQNFDPRPRK